MQLINSSIFDQETQARNKAIAETRRLKAQKKAAREESMVLRHAQSASRFSESNRSEAQPDGRAYTIFVGDIPFQVAQGGSKLISLSSEDILMITIGGSRISLWFIDDPLKANVTPKRVKVGGVTFVRSKRGNLHRLGAVVSKKYAISCPFFPFAGYLKKLYAFISCLDHFAYNIKENPEK